MHACARSDAAANGNVGICSYLFESVMQLSMGRAARVCSPGTSGQHFSRARITICSIRSRQSLKLFDARGLSMRLHRPRDPTRTYRQLVPEAMHASHHPWLLIMNIVFYDPAFSFPRPFLSPSYFLSLSLSLFFGIFVAQSRSRLSRAQNHERVFDGVVMADFDGFHGNFPRSMFPRRKFRTRCSQSEIA